MKKFSLFLVISVGICMSRVVRWSLGALSQGPVVPDAVFLEQLTPEQEEAMNQFQKFANPLMKLQLYKRKVHLLKYLIANDFDLSKAKKQFLSVVQWRLDNSMDNVTEEDYSIMKQVYKVEIGKNFDKKGRPILFAPILDFNICEGVASRGKETFTRFWLGIWEEAARAAIRSVDRGSQWAQYVHIVDFHDIATIFNPLGNNVDCVEFVHSTHRNLDSKWPLIVYKYIVVNVPPLGEWLFPELKSAFGPYLTGNLHIFSDPKAWKPFLLQYISEKQLPNISGKDVKITSKADQYLSPVPEPSGLSFLSIS